ncbi:probable glutamate carboxypeptidase LAMP1 [Arachis hypogaea]|uniref:probable glutamate carboxypeptidase LAMP1 n=1 Tax=Arachis hypogaea TaxID=3818 RepID=UPI0007AFB925|nr:probable glutamate carboxypeptidase LAMP1 [Arachis hypogaea]
MQNFGDPMFHRHVAAASVWGLVALWLADEEFLPFDYQSYAKELQLNVKNLEDEISNKDMNLSPILKSIKELEKAAIKINDQRKEIEASKGWRTWKEYQMKVRDVNDRLMMAERAFTDRDGLLGMTWHNHLLWHQPATRNMVWRKDNGDWWHEGETEHYGFEPWKGLRERISTTEGFETEGSTE